MSELKVGDKAPKIDLPSNTGKNISLKDFNGKKHVVLYFYPKDDTPGCTTQACGFRDEISNVKKLKAVVLGVSPDNPSKHEKFITKYDLPFNLLSDEEKTTCTDYGVWVEKSMYGRKYMGVARTTFIINKEGIISHIFDKVKPKDHAAEVLEVLKTL